MFHFFAASKLRHEKRAAASSCGEPRKETFFFFFKETFSILGVFVLLCEEELRLFLLTLTLDVCTVCIGSTSKTNSADNVCFLLRSFSSEFDDNCDYHEEKENTELQCFCFLRFLHHRWVSLSDIRRFYICDLIVLNYAT